MAASLPESDVANALSSIERLTNDELSGLLSDEGAFENFIQNLPQVKAWESDRELLVASNKSLAEYNLSFEPKLRDGKAQLSALYAQAQQLKNALESKRLELESLAGRTSLDTTHALLQAAGAESEERSEILQQEFLDGKAGLEVEEFVRKFQELRTEAHMRKLKAEKLGKLVRMGGISGQHRGSTSSSGGGSSVPYPILGTGMPMPPGM